MGIILDSSILIGAERGRFDFERFLNKYSTEPMALAAITVAELLHGWERAKPSVKEGRGHFVTGLIEKFPIAEFGLSEARHYAHIWAHLAGKNIDIGAHDTLIAASALSLDYAVATLNEKDFRQVPGLRLVKVLA